MMTDKSNAELETLLKELLSTLAAIDRSNELAMKKRIDTMVKNQFNDDFRGIGWPCGSPESYEIQIAKEKNIKIKMYKEDGHEVPHIHIDMPDKNHAASFSIEPPEKLVGDDCKSLSKKYEKAIIKWLIDNKDPLLSIWKKLQSGVPAAQEDNVGDSIDNTIELKISSVF